HGELLGHSQTGTDQSPSLPYQEGSHPGYHRVHRDFLQPDTNTGGVGFPITGGLSPEILCRSIGGIRGLVSEFAITPQGSWFSVLFGGEFAILFEISERVKPNIPETD